LPFRNNLAFFAIDLDQVIRKRPAFLGPMLQETVRRVRDGELQPLPHRGWPIAEWQDAFRFMQQGKHIGKVVLTLRDQGVAAVPCEDEPLTFRTDGSYLITGGLGGFGQAVARWMAARGAGHLVLMGRRGEETPGAEHAITELEQLGARVVVCAGDVAQSADLRAVLAAIDRDLPPLRGVVHAAMVLEDALLTNLDDDRIDRVLAPKVSGTWNLHAQTLGRPLDFFAMFSSLSSVFGHAGQASYAAANAFLDALAWHRRALGLPALTINWGYLGEAGYLARHSTLGARLERQGVLSMSNAEALAALEKAMQREYVQVSAMRLDGSRWRGLGVTGRLAPRLAHLCRQSEAALCPELQQGLSGRDALRAAAPGERRQLLESLLQAKIAGVLATSPERLDIDRPLLQLGLDSLMAVELRNWIESELQVGLPVVELMRSPSLTYLAELVAQRLETGSEHLNAALDPQRADPAQTDGLDAPFPRLESAPEALLERLADLSGDQVDVLLATLLQEGHHGSR
jgi:NAD(P)-dependent dehydrogenase (short-subunit alcohol dehydrogenase family)/aryl carrier-like protein